jgi:hypothetical protein
VNHRSLDPKRFFFSLGPRLAVEALVNVASLQDREGTMDGAAEKHWTEGSPARRYGLCVKSVLSLSPPSDLCLSVLSQEQVYHVVLIYLIHLYV